MDLIDKTKQLLDYFTWVGEDPVERIKDQKKMASLIHPDFIITYNGKAVICGIEQLGQHFLDGFKEIGHWHLEYHSFELLGNMRCIAKYSVVTEKKGSTPCEVIYEFIDGLAIGQHEYVDFSLNNIDTSEWYQV